MGTWYQAPERRNGAGRTPWSQLPWSHKVPYLYDAEAARKSFFAALQEPTEGMLAVPYKYRDLRSIIRDVIAASPLGEQSE